MPKHLPTTARHRGVVGRLRCLRRGGERGSGTVELVIATPLLLLLVMGIIQFGLLWHAQHVAQAAAAQAVAAERAYNVAGTAGQQRGRQVLSQLGAGDLPHASISVTRIGGQAAADVTGQAQSIIPGWHPGVHAHAAAPLEMYVP
jgi:Flp pilus assembly protein TadG